MTAEELQDKLLHFGKNYFLNDIRNDKENFYSLSKRDLKRCPVCYGGLVLNLFMDEEWKKAESIKESLPEDNPIRLGITLVDPTIDWREFVRVIRVLKKINMPMTMVSLTAGRPFLLNGFNDFTRLGPLLEHYKETCIDGIQYLYGTESAPYIFNLSLAEYYYQQNKLIEAELLVSRAIKEFHEKQEYRFLFVSLYLQTEIYLANGSITKTENYIKDIKKRVTEHGKAEFSNNINAAEVRAAFFEGKYDVISSWMANEAPDEVGDYNLLDLYRYMVKIRCYIYMEKREAAVSLIEKLRPALEKGRRNMDLCEIDLLLSITLFYAGKKELAYEALERALKIVHRRKYYRLVADDGVAMFDVLVEYAKDKGENSFLLKLIDMTREMAILYPLYLQPRFQSSEHFTKMEVDILKLLQQGKTQEEIGAYFFITLNTVKYHLKKIYHKLGVTSATQAVWNATLLGLL